MPAILSGYEYDIFISYRQNDNKRDGWVTNFVDALNDELEATSKENISVYFDANPHDGLHDTHDVDDSLKEKVKCLIFIPIISRTYCDPNSFAWQKELLPFIDFAGNDNYGLKVKLTGGNVANRILPIRIHEISEEDKKLVEDKIGFLRPVDFVYQEAGINRPLKPEDKKEDNLNNTNYHNQINKAANAIQDIISGLKAAEASKDKDIETDGDQISPPKKSPLASKIKQRSVVRASLAYILAALAFWKITDISSALLNLSERNAQFITLALIVIFPIAMLMAWLYERSPQGLIRAGSAASRDNPFTDAQKKPLTSNVFILLLLATVTGLFVIFPSGASGPQAGITASEVSIGIIPFRNNTGDKELNHYGVGLASEVRTELSLSKQFDFISSLQATIKYQNSDDDPQQIGKELGVTHIVSGMYQLAGTNMHVIVEMVEAATGKIVWSLPYNTQYDDLFSLQADIAEKVMEKFAVNKNDKRAVPTRIMEAYANYTRGEEIAASTNQILERSESIPYYQKAIQLDSGYLQAWIGVIEGMSYYYFNRNDTVYTPEMIKPYYDYVEANFPESWMKNEVRGIYAYWVEGEYNVGREYFEQALEENPLAPNALGLIGAIYRRTMHHNKAIENRALFVKTAPNSISTWNELAFIFEDNGDYEKAELARLKMYALDNDNYIQLYGLKRVTSSLDELPESVKVARGNTFKADLLLQQRNFSGLNLFLDTIKLDSSLNMADHAYYKAINYYNLREDDSSKIYAQKFLNTDIKDISLYRQFSGRYAMLSILGLREEANHYLTRAFGIEVHHEDQTRQFGYKARELQYLAINGEYLEAGDLLRKMNKDYPKVGSYAWLNLPILDRIKEEYPPFVDIINSLQMPPKLTEVDRLKM
jgi:TolB-like protein